MGEQAKVWIGALVVGMLTLSACGADEMSADTAGAAEDSAAAENEEITNNQEAGVDEGGIVKNIGDHLVVLRQGRLFAVDVSRPGDARQSDSARVALDEDLNQEVWYDEMLVRGRDIYVVGYRYVANLQGTQQQQGYGGTGTTEIAHFYLEEGGDISRMETQFFESMDYYSGTNYTSRRIDDQLIFYIPFSSRYSGTSTPKMLEYLGDGRFRRAQPIFSQADVVNFGGVTLGGDTIHTLVTCPITDGARLECSAKALRGGWWTTRYVTRDDVYLWSNERVYAMSLTDGTISAHAVDGQVIDQFSMRFDGESLQAIVRRKRSTQHNRNYTGQDQTALLTLPRVDFDEVGQQSLEGKLEVLQNDTLQGQGESWSYMYKNRFVEDTVVFAMSSWDEDSEQNSEHLYIHDLSTGASQRFDLGEASVTRIEPMRGVGALVSATSWEREKRGLFGWRSRWTANLELRVFTPDEQGAMRQADRVELDGVAEGEWRSHGFFFKPGEQGGAFGLPIIGQRGLSGWWGSGVSNIAFFDVSGGGKLDMIGAVSSSKDAEGQCETSCTDWYGNTRPIFLRDRVFALMGSELAEVSLLGKLHVLDRLILEF